MILCACVSFLPNVKAIQPSFALNGSEERVPLIHAQVVCQKAQMSHQAFT
jgi:hypothetical protein